MKKAAILATIFAAASLSVCLWRAATQPVIISGTVQAQEESPELLPEPDEGHDAEVMTIHPMPADYPGTEDLIISLPPGIGSEGISSENNYLSHLLRITLHTDSDPHGQLTCTAAPDKVHRGILTRAESGELNLYYDLTGLYEPVMSLIDSTLHIRLETPKDLYRHVVLVDPAERGNSTTDISLRAAQALTSLYSENSSTAIYLTRRGDEWSEEQTLTLLQETGADLFLRLHNGSPVPETTEPSSSADGFTVCYNDKWFLRKYSNAEFARDLSVSLAKATGHGVNAILPTGSEDLLLEAPEVPAAAVYLGETGDSARIAKGLAEVLSDALVILDDMQEEK